MDRRSWLWRRRSTEKCPTGDETESSASSPSERLTDEQDTPKPTPSPEIASKEAQDNNNVKVKVLSERLSSAVLDIRAKDDLVKQHSKVAEEAVLGWEKAEKEIASLKTQLNAATVKNSTLEDRIVHLDGALKECVRQLRRAKEEQDQKVQDALAQQARRWESEKTDIELRIIELKAKLEAKSELSVTTDSDASSRLASREKENSVLKVQLLAKAEELELRTIEKELNRRAAETASKQQIESIKKMAKLEAECRRLQATARRSSFSVELRRAPSSVCAESVTDCQSDCSDSWASALITELDQFKNEKSSTRSASLATADIGMMDDFLEMEKLASANGSSKSEVEDASRQLVKLEEKVKKLTAEKADREKALHEVQRELRASRHRAMVTEEKSVELQRQLNLVNGEKHAVETEMEAGEMKRNELEGKLELSRAEIASLLDKGRILEERLESEKALTLELAAKYQHMDALESERKELRIQLEASQSDARKFSDKITLLERNLEEEKAFSARFAAKCHGIEALEAKKKGVELELKSAREEITSFKKKLSSLELKIQEEKALSAEFGSPPPKTHTARRKRTQTLAMSGDRRGGGPPGSGDRSGGGWETIEKKSKKSGQAVGRGQWAPWSSSANAAPTTARQAWNGNGSSRPSGNNWAQLSDRRPAARGNPRPPPQTKSTETELQAPHPVVTPPLAHGWQWASRPRPSGSESKKDDVPSSGCDPEMDNAEDDVSDDDNDDDMSDDISDEYDSDASEKSFETRKTNKWFKSFFEVLETLSVDQINEQTRQWHCPACKNGPGAIDWYKGLQPLMTHARTKGSTRVKLHRELAALLEEELSRRGTSVVPSGEQFGKWKGLRESTDREIVWPPMVIVMNTLLEKDDDDKWIGMGNQELLDYFSEYAATKARHAYGPCGHRGMSLLIFESSAVGYMEAERLHRHFVDQRTDRESWQNHRIPFLPGGKRQLYGFLAKKEDMETFNKHCQGKSRLKYEMRSYNEMVVVQMKQMSEDNQQLNYLKNKVVKTEQRSKVVEETLGVITQKLRETMEENIFVRSKAKEKHLEYEQEMKFQEEFFHDQIERIHKATEEKEMAYEKMLQEERAKARQCDVDSGTTEDRKLRKEQIQRFIDCQVKDVEEFEAERDELIKVHEEKKVKLRTEYMAKEFELEKELDAALTVLMEKHKPDTFQAPSS